jgi:hypothetical protein
MKLKLALLAVFFVCGPLISSLGKQQRHTPSIVTCRSDATAWNKEEDVGPKGKDVGYQVSYGELLKREGEMMDCMMLDAQHGPDGGVVEVRTSYKTIYHIYGTALMVRYLHFLERHQLMEKFVDEDEKGLR